MISTKELATRFINDMCDNGFSTNDPTEARNRSIESWKELFDDDTRVCKVYIARVRNNTYNLLRYCGWTLELAHAYVQACGYTAEHVTYLGKEDDKHVTTGLRILEDDPNMENSIIYTTHGMHFTK